MLLIDCAGMMLLCSRTMSSTLISKKASSGRLSSQRCHSGIGSYMAFIHYQELKDFIRLIAYSKKNFVHHVAMCFMPLIYTCRIFKQF
jgi:hypothetical protein